MFIKFSWLLKEHPLSVMNMQIVCLFGMEWNPQLQWQ